MDKEKNESEVEKLFDNLPKDDKEQADIFKVEKPEDKKEETTPEKEISEEDEEPHKNRRHRRWETQLSEREKDLIAREARLEALSETSQFAQATNDVDPRWLQIYGDTPESRKAWGLQQDIFNDYTSKVKEELLQETRNAQLESQRQTKEFESVIDSNLESIEDQFNVDITSNFPSARKTRKEFLEMVQTLSPKDEDGTITDYADFNAVWGMYQSQKSKPDVTRNKEIADRSMEKSSSSSSSEKELTPGFRGWQKDYNL